MLKKTIMFAAVAGLVLALSPAAQAVILYEEHFVDSRGRSAPSYGNGNSQNTAQELVWPAPLVIDWVPGLNTNQSDIGWDGMRYSSCISDQYETYDHPTAGDGLPGSPQGNAPSPDGDGWHFFGFHDGGDRALRSNPGEVNIASAARLGTQFSVDWAMDRDKGLRWLVQVGGGNWYSTAYFANSLNGATNGQVDTGGPDGHGAVNVWAPTEICDVETATWYLWNNDPSDGEFSDPEDLSTTGISLPGGDITGLGIIRQSDGKIAVDNFVVTGIPEPATAVLLLIGAPLLALRRRRR